MISSKDYRAKVYKFNTQGMFDMAYLKRVISLKLLPVNEKHISNSTRFFARNKVSGLQN